MARINIPAPISGYRDLGTVELSKLARNQYIEGYGAADQFSNSVSNMQSLKKDAHLKTKLSNQYSGMLDKWSSRGDYETLGLAINKGASQFVKDYAPLQQSVKNREEYQKSLKDAYEKKRINANTYQGRMAQSDSMYQGVQYDENGQLLNQSVYAGKEFYNDVDISEKINKRLKELKPFIRQNLGTEIPHNEDMEITNTQGARGEVKYWVTTRSKTVQLPDNIIQSVVNDVMQDPDVSASLAQQVDLQTYQLSDKDAMGYITKLIESKDIKEEEVAPMLENMSPKVVLQNIMYQDEVARETNLALGAFGGVRESSSGRTMKYDAVWKQNNKAKLESAKASVPEGDLSYSTLLTVKPTTTSHENSVEKITEQTNLLKTNLSKVTNHVNVNPDNIEYNEEGTEIFGSGGEGYDLETMNNAEIIMNAENAIQEWKETSANASIVPLDYIPFKRTKAPKRNEGESAIEYQGRVDDAFADYKNKMLNKREMALNHLDNIAGANNLDVQQYSNIMNLMSGNFQTIDVINAKLKEGVNLSIPNSDYGNNLSVNEYKAGRGGQLLNSTIGTITGQDIVDAYNSLAEKNPETMSTISHPHEIPEHIYSGNLWNNMTTNSKDVNTDGHELINALARIKSAQGDAVSSTYVEPLGGWQWDQSAYEQGSDFRKSIEGWFGQLSEDNSSTKVKFKGHFNDKQVNLQAMVLTNMGEDFSTLGVVKKDLDRFFKSNTIPSNFVIRDAQGQTRREFKDGLINSKQENDKNHFNYNVTYDILEDQMGVLNVSLGDEGPMVYVPIKIKNSPAKGSNAEDLKGKVFNMLVPAHYITIPSLTQYVNSAEMEVNSEWNAGVLAGLKQPFSPIQYSNVTFDYGSNEVIIDGEKHSKEKGLSILVQNKIDNRSRK